MTDNEAVDILAEIEREMDVTNLLFRGMRVWPLIRQRLWANFLNPYLHSLSLPKESRREVRFDLSEETLHLLQQAGPKDVVFISRPQDNNELLRGKRYNRFVDPLMEVLPEELSGIKLEMDEEQDDTDSDIPSLSIMGEMKVSGPFPEENITGFKRLNRILSQICSLQLDQDIIIKDALVARAYADMYGIFLDKLQPKAVMLVCYYHVPMNGLALACRERGIVCVDLQHGRQGRFHGAYTHWTVFPKSGWEFCASHFWCWGEPTEADMKRHLPKRKEGLPQFVVGGYPWLGMCANGDALDQKAETRQVEELVQGRPAILVTLQLLWEDMIEEIGRAIQISPPDWIWLIRMHPKQIEKIDEVKKQLSSVSGCYEIEAASSLPLYLLLKESCCHVTSFSTCCFEALHFDVPTVLWGESGAILYKEYVDDGTFLHAMTGEQIQKNVARMETVKECSGMDCIEISSHIAIKAIETILSQKIVKFVPFKVTGE